MDNATYAAIIQYFDSKYNECLIQKSAYEKWLSVLTPLRWTAILISVIVPAFTGATILIDTGLLSKEHWKVVCSVVLIVSSIVTGLYTAFKWDAQQSECLRLSKQYQSLANKFETARTADQTEIEQYRKTLSEKFSDLVENTMTTPAQWCINSARKAVMR